MKRTVLLPVLLLFVNMTASQAIAQERTAQAGVEDELTALVQAVNRLVMGLENNQAQQKHELSLRRVGLAVEVLDIRARQYDALQEQIRAIDDREQKALANISAFEASLKILKRQISDATDDSFIVELEAELDQLKAYIDNNQKTVEYLSIKRVDLQNRLIEREQSIADAESVVETWLEDLQGRPTAAQPAR